MSEDNNEGRYLYIVDYEEDAERKRAEYLLIIGTRERSTAPAGLSASQKELTVTSCMSN